MKELTNEVNKAYNDLNNRIFDKASFQQGYWSAIHNGVNSIDSIEIIKEKFKLSDSWGNTSDPDECYNQGLKDMYDAIEKILNN